ncbi:ATP-grasp domain-domain-containing protein [Clohesyomyces aquaticus]|uniref:ATP-grasp domain-domain-containing protein n=1 Tax=Clohesyomyces aquaticus TaxID=1231657 RepID=A0A1Y2A4M5_9PLEO|nr:ATP-grasp domain-domain-containing protein [Clohesyomyces aquaticus]
MSNILFVKEKGGGREIQFQFNWHSVDVSAATETTSSRCVILSLEEISKSPEFSWPEKLDDILLFIQSSLTKCEQIDPKAWGSSEALQFLIDTLSDVNTPRALVAIGLILPATAGYIIRSDIIPLRLVHCSVVTRAVSFAKPDKQFPAAPVGAAIQLPDVLQASAGGLLFKRESYTGTNSLDFLSKNIGAELANRLSFPWVSKQKPERKTLVIVEGGRSGPDNGGTGESIYTAAHALGIEMVVFDNSGHWMNDPRYAHWCKEFIPFKLELQPADDFPNQIVEAVRSLKYRVDGIVTFCDHYKAPVAQAALELQLPTYSPEAYMIATDKFRTSVSEGHHAYQASSAPEARSIVLKHNMEFPLIIKPCNGFLSEGVFRVEDVSQLEAGIQAINTDRHGKEFVIEKYCEGPELDANLVLCDGELLFFEASDDFPKSADANGQGHVKSFIELANVLPSKLPESELMILRDSLHQSLLRMGFQDGFYHLEARLENSSMEYATKKGIFDLTERTVPAWGAPSSWLIEVNPRPPGIQESAAVKYTYGVDYFGLGLLFALNDKSRARQLSHSFVKGPQYWCEMVFIPVEQSGVYESGDVCAELFDRRPDLAHQVSDCFCFLKKGAILSVDGGVNSWVAYFIVYSRESRTHVLELSETIRREVKFSIV